ncbi:DNA primase [Lacihabitans soyangensis]|uniref:DNA primase n=1 Tax=Lacihabitans soyangensis TaxID=869394 RepID=A0AAE3H4W7_9BACT|nr:DNA primase [Lacihabitans soyangensis]MCP9764968.1 DNA primase [Lacihabitans soyangensis]
MIPQDTVQQIIQAADIVEVVGEFVSLKKRGASMIACCPFHNEKTPSFNVSPSKGIYKCFGCGKGGDSLRFVMDLEGLSYPDALRWLAKKYNIEVKEREFTDQDLISQNEKESLFIVLEYAQQYFAETMANTEEGQSVGQSYFIERGFSKAAIEKFQLGYALDSRNEFVKKAEKAGFSSDILEKAGLISVKEGDVKIDRFRGRVIFPIHNVAGKPIAFGARILKTDPKAPKYINSPETEIYHKSQIVYGIYQAKNAIRQADNCYLVEGYTDVVSLHQAGIENVVASSGTSLTPEQVRLIRRFSDNITVLYDGDAAGIKASLRGIDIILEEDMNVKSVVFPDGDDPDSYIRKVGGAAFSEYVKNHQKNFINFKTELSLADVGDDAIKKAELIADLVSSITKIPNPIKRSVFYQEVAKMLQIDENILINEGNKIVKTKITDNNKRIEKGDGGIISPAPPIRNQELEIINTLKKHNVQEEALVRDLVLYGHFVIEKDEETGQDHTLADYLLHETNDLRIETPLFYEIYQLYKTEYLNGNAPTSQMFSSNPNPQIQDVAVSWLSPKHELSERWDKFEIFIPKYEEMLNEFSYRMVLRIRKEKIQKEIDALIEEVDTASDEDLEIIMNQVGKKRGILKLIAEELGSVI